MTSKDIISIINEYGSVSYRLTYNNGKKEHLRLFISDSGMICYKPKNIRRYGYIMPQETINSIVSCVPPIVHDNVTIVKRFMNLVIKYLSKSGMWSEIKDDYIKILEQGDEYLARVIEMDFSEQRNYLESTIGVNSFHVDEIIYSAKKGIKHINYHSYEKNNLRSRIIDLLLLKNNDRFSHRWTKGYDNYVEYRNENGNLYGWYSEEYIGCGNGHYYLAIDESHAIFVEHD